MWVNFVLATNAVITTPRRCVETTGVHWATDTAQAVDRSGSTTLIVWVPRHSWIAVLTTAGAYMTAGILRTSLSSARVIQLRQAPVTTTFNSLICILANSYSLIIRF